MPKRCTGTCRICGDSVSAQTHEEAGLKAIAHYVEKHGSKKKNEPSLLARILMLPTPWRDKRP